MTTALTAAQIDHAAGGGGWGLHGDGLGCGDGPPHKRIRALRAAGRSSSPSPTTTASQMPRDDKLGNAATICRAPTGSMTAQMPAVLKPYRDDELRNLRGDDQQTIFLPVIGLVQLEKLKPGDLVGVNKDTLPLEYDYRLRQWK